MFFSIRHASIYIEIHSFLNVGRGMFSINCIMIMITGKYLINKDVFLQGSLYNTVLSPQNCYQSAWFLNKKIWQWCHMTSSICKAF